MTLKIRALIRTRTRPVSPILGMKLHFVNPKIPGLNLGTKCIHLATVCLAALN